MKRFLYIVLTLVLVSCEVIPYEERYQPVVPSGKSERCHVLIEFTGFRCVNCPTASELAQSLQETYEGKLVVVAMHPASNPFTQGKYDYTCPAADSIYKWMGGDASTPFPAGNVDMNPYDGEWFANSTEWATMVYEAMNETDVPKTDDLKTCYWVVEDSVLGVQAMPDGSVNDHYYHRHVLRGAWDKWEDVQVPDGSYYDHLRLITLTIDPIDKHIVNAYESAFYSSSLGD